MSTHPSVLEWGLFRRLVFGRNRSSVDGLRFGCAACGRGGQASAPSKERARGGRWRRVEDDSGIDIAQLDERPGDRSCSDTLELCTLGHARDSRDGIRSGGRDQISSCGVPAVAVVVLTPGRRSVASTAPRQWLLKRAVRTPYECARADVDIAACDGHCRHPSSVTRPLPSGDEAQKPSKRDSPLSVFGRVGPTHCCAGPPSEPGRARFRAPGSSKPLRLVGGQKCQVTAVAAVGVYETGLRSSGVPSSRMMTLVIVLRVVASHVSHSRGVCGRSSSGTSASWQIGQRPSWTLMSHRLVLSIGRVSCADALPSSRRGRDHRVMPRRRRSGVGRCWSTRTCAGRRRFCGRRTPTGPAGPCCVGRSTGRRPSGSACSHG